MDYRIEQKEPVVLQGYKCRFSGSPKARDRQGHEFICKTRLNQAVLQYMAHDVDTLYGVFSHLDDDGYDYHVAAALADGPEAEVIHRYYRKKRRGAQCLALSGALAAHCNDEKATCLFARQVAFVLI